jgi:biotin carboxyl carrier protein
MDLEEIKKLIDLFEKSNLSKFCIKKKDAELILEKGKKEEVKLVKREVEPEKPLEEDGCFIKSPMVGTFYALPAPDQKPFVKEGDQVEPETIVCIVEAMKVLNEVKAGVSGVIKEVLCKNGSPVEFGTKLFKIEKL